jgi:transposase
MSRIFKTVDYEASLNQTVRLGDVLPADHLARFLVDAIAQLDLRPLYSRFGPRGGEAYAPEVLLGLLFYGYATGVFSSRKIEQATYEALPYRFLAGGLHPDHDTIANFRKTFLGELTVLFVEVLLLAQAGGLLQLGDISLDGSKVHADASTSKAVSYKRASALIAQLQAEVAELFALAEQADQAALPAGLDVAAEIARRDERLARLQEAKAVLEARAKERDAVEQAAYDEKLREREEKTARTGRRPRGKPPTPPTPGARDDDQSNFTDPESRIMKNPTNKGFDQHYNTQLAVEQAHLFIVGYAVSNHPTDQGEVAPTVASIPEEVGTPDAAALDTGYFSETNIHTLEERGIDPYIATGRTAHQQGWLASVAPQPALPPPEDATPREKMAYKLQTEVGRAIYRLRKCTVEPVFGCLKEVLGFRQFSLRGLEAVTGEWCLLCLARNLKRLHTLLCAQGRTLPGAALFGVPWAPPRTARALGAAAHRASLIADTWWQMFLILILVGVCRPQPSPSLFSPTAC